MTNFEELHKFLENFEEMIETILRNFEVIWANFRKFKVFILLYITHIEILRYIG